MNILHVITSMDPAHGGPPAVAARLAAAQAALGQTVGIACLASPGRDQAISASLDNIPGIDRVTRIELPPRLILRAIVPGGTKTVLNRRIAPSDVVHIHSVWEPLVHQAAILARKMGKPYVITTHGVLDPWCLQQKRLKKKVALALSYRKMLQRAGCLHLLNRDEADLIAPLRLTTPKRVIPNGVFLEEIEPLPVKGTFHARHPELRGEPFVLFLSRLHFKKGLDYLAEAFAMAAKPDGALNGRIRLVVAGPDGGAQTDFEQRIAKAGLTDRVHLVGPLYGRDKFAAMVDAACFCLPSRQEGFSMAITEAMACGCPVVISCECHFPEVAEVQAGEIVALDGGAVGAALHRVMSDSTKASEMGQAGRELVLSRFTWPTIARQTLEMYAALADGTAWNSRTPVSVARNGVSGSA